NGIDDDNDGAIDNMHGADFRAAASVTSFPTGPSPQTCLGDITHGTPVHGAMSATANNATGIAGVAWKAKVMQINVHAYSNPSVTSNCGTDGSMSSFSVLSANAWAIKKKQTGTNIRVINMSLEAPQAPSKAISDVINAAGENGILVVQSAGNSSQTNPRFPTNTESKNFMFVGSSDAADNRSSFSDYGDWVDISAPGSFIWTTKGSDKYLDMNGTSYSAPIVSAAAALLAAHNPALSPSQIRQCLRDSVDVKPQLAGMNATSGRLNLHKALSLPACQPAANTFSLGGKVSGLVTGRYLILRNSDNENKQNTSL
nr:S8 family serine peptidase [Pyrinomonadaceae bacterium]